MNWIKMMVDIGDDPKIHRLAETLRVPIGHAVGVYLLVLAQFPAHAKDGDVSAVPDGAIEEWAKWKGPRGRFASAFRTICCDESGIVAAWEKINGAAIRNAERSADRAREWREENAKRTRDERRTNLVRTQDETRRDEREEEKGQEQLPAPSASRRTREPAALKPGAKYPHFALADRQAVHAAWEKCLGPVDFGALVKAFSPAFAAEPRPFTLAELAEAIDCARVEAICLDTSKRSTVEQGQLTPRKFVARMNVHLEHARTPMVDPVTRRPTEWGAFVERWYGVTP